MTGVKKLILSQEERLGEVLLSLRAEGYNMFTVYFSGHPRHAGMGLVASQVLVHAWRYKPRPDKTRTDRDDRKKGYFVRGL